MPMVSGPDGVLYNAPTGGGLLSAFDPDYQSQQLQLKQAQAFKDGVPKDADNNPDYGAMATRLMQLGDYGNADKLMTSGIQMDGMRAAQRAASDPLLTGGGGAPAGSGPLSSFLSGSGAPAAGGAPVGGGASGGGAAAPQGGASAPVAAPSLKAANPEVVDYIRKAFTSRRVSPDVALAVGATEGLRGFDPNGNANAGDGNSSFGPFQLHYGGVAPGGNSVAGLGDDFTKATGLNARDPSTWKAQVDFVADHVAQHGWGAFHGAAKAKIGNWSGIGMPGSTPGAGPLPASMTATAAPQAAPASAPPRAAAAAQPATPATRPTPGAVVIDPTSDTLPPGTVTDSQYQNALKVATQAENMDPRQMTPQSQRAATLATAMVTRYRQQQATPPAGVAANGAPVPTLSGDPSKPVQVAENGANDGPPVSSVHPMGPGGPSAGRQPPQPAPAAAPQAAPAALAQAASPAPANGAPVMTDPTMGGLLKGQWVGNPGGYALALRQRAASYSANPFTKPTGELFSKMADQIDQSIARNNITTPEMKNYEVARGQGYTGTMQQFAVDQAREKADAENASRLQADTDPARLRFGGQLSAAQAAGTEQGKAPYELVQTQPQPGGPTTMVPKTDILSGAASGVTKQPAQFAQQQEAIAKNEAAMQSQFQARQAAHERIDAMSDLLSVLQTGYGTPAFSDAVAKARAAGINIPDSILGNPGAVQQFGKNATANIFSAAKEMGGKVLVSELEGLKASNANASMQPEANQAILAQQKGILDHEDAYFNAYNDWKGKNPYALQNDVSKFDASWSKANPVGKFVDAAKKNIAPLGLALPPKDKLVDGQAYMVKGQKAKWSAAQNGFVPVAAN